MLSGVYRTMLKSADVRFYLTDVEPLKYLWEQVITDQGQQYQTIKISIQQTKQTQFTFVSEQTQVSNSACPPQFLVGDLVR